MPVGTVAPRTQPPALETPAAPPAADKGEGQYHTTDSVTRTKRYAGSVIPFGIGAAVTLKYGIDELRDHHIKDGTVDVIRGCTGILSNAKLVVLASSLIPIAGPIVAAAGVVAASASLIGSPLDGGRDVYDGIRDHKGQTAVIGGIKLVAAGVGAVGSLTANPLLIGAGIVIGLSTLAVQNRKALPILLDKIKHKLGMSHDEA